jgi:CHAT domain-containing protein
VAPDDELFTLPFAALRSGQEFLVERHATQVVSGASLVAASRARPWEELLSGAFVGVGDPIYNRADARVAGNPGHPGAGPFRLHAAGGLQLPRLVASAHEIELCAAAWRDTHPTLLVGAAAAKEPIEKALRARPAVLHLATHVLESAQRSRFGLIVS